MTTTLRTLTLLLCVALAAASGAAASDESAPTVTVTRPNDDVFVVDASFDVAASPDTVWQVLTDYEGIAGFVSSVRESSIKSREAGHVVVEQSGVGRVWFVSVPMHVVLEVREHGTNEITFRDVCGKTFRTYHGRWHVTPIANLTRVSYHLEADPVNRQPGAIARSVMRKNVHQLLNELRREIEARSRQ